MSNNNVNSFTETVSLLIDQVNIAMSNVVALNKSITTQNDTITMSVDQSNPVTGDPSTIVFSLPSYNNIINTVNALSETVDTFIKGEGVILLKDNTYRKVTTQAVAISPSTINNVTPPTKFKTRSNWFFESMMFPQLVISFDLKGKIDNRSDRVVVKRVIFDNFNEEETQWFLDNIAGTQRSYYDTISFLNEQGKRYWEDQEIQNVPLEPQPYTGAFVIQNKRTIDGNEWFFLDTVYYGETTDAILIKNRQLTAGDLLRYKNSIWRIDDIRVNEMRIRVIPMVGTENPTIGNLFEIYSEPFKQKKLDIPIGYDECNIIFLKGVNDDFNVIGVDWGIGIPFWTNNLIKDGTNISLSNYYINYVADFGKQLEGQAKEKFIPAFYGIQPNAPVLSTDFFKVVQINTQLNASLDKEQVKNTQTQIESTKTLINSLKDTIAQQKAQLVELTDVGKRSDLDSKISSNINSLSKKTIEYQSLVRSLGTIAYENSAVEKTAKYHIRGFFPIPSPVGNPPQNIISFEYAYRYMRLDNTGNPLQTMSYRDPSTNQEVIGTYSDWMIVSTPILKKVYDENLEIFVWKNESISDGQENNINQVDIPIQRGEKVELKIRSISEAGWPLNPLKSDWSESIIIDFPANLFESDQVANILKDAAAEEAAIKLNETLSSAGVTTHISDSIPNPNAGEGTYYKHQAINLAFDLKVKDIGGVTTVVNSTNLQSQIENLPAYTYITLTAPTGANPASGPHITGTLQKLLQAIVNTDPSIYNEFHYLVTQ